MGCRISTVDNNLNKHKSIDPLWAVYHKQKDDDYCWLRIFSNNQYSLYDLERHKDLIDWNECSQYQALPCWFIAKYKSRINFDKLSYNRHLTDNIIDKFADELSFHILIFNKTLSQKLAEKFLLQDRIHSIKKRILLKEYKFSETLLDSVLDENRYIYSDVISQYQKLSDMLIIKYASSLNLELINVYQFISEDLIMNHPELIIWNKLSYNKHLTFNIVVKYRDKLKNTEEVETAKRS